MKVILKKNTDGNWTYNRNCNYKDLDHYTLDYHLNQGELIAESDVDVFIPEPTEDGETPISIGAGQTTSGTVATEADVKTAFEFLVNFEVDALDSFSIHEHTLYDSLKEVKDAKDFIVSSNDLAAQYAEELVLGNGTTLTEAEYLTLLGERVAARSKLTP